MDKEANMEETADEKLQQDARHNLLIDTERGHRYHEERWAFCRFWCRRKLAAQHKLLMVRFIRLYGEVLAVEHPTLDQNSAWIITLHAIYEDEPPVYKAVNAVAANAVIQAHAYDAKFVSGLKWYHRLFRNVLRFSNIKFRGE